MRGIKYVSGILTFFSLDIVIVTPASVVLTCKTDEPIQVSREYLKIEDIIINSGDVG